MDFLQKRRKLRFCRIHFIRTTWFNFKYLNNFLDALGLRNFGAYHVGVEVYGDEWQYGYCPHGSGISRIRPRINRDHVYTKSLWMGETGLRRQEIYALLRRVQDDWQGSV